MKTAPTIKDNHNFVITAYQDRCSMAYYLEDFRELK